MTWDRQPINRLYDSHPCTTTSDNTDKGMRESRRSPPRKTTDASFNPINTGSERFGRMRLPYTRTSIVCASIIRLSGTRCEA